MSQYYFTVASLPNLDFESETSFRFNDFLEVCRSTLDKEDFKIVESASLDMFESRMENSTLNRWIVFEQSLRNELVKLRSPELGIDPEKYLRHFVDDTTTPLIARNAVKQEDPFKAEAFIDRARWSFLEEMEVGHFFDLEKLIVYSLKLQILERRAHFKEEQGKENFQEIYEQIKTAIRNA